MATIRYDEIMINHQRCERTYATNRWPSVRRCQGQATYYAHVPTHNPQNPKETETLIVCAECAAEAEDAGIKTGRME